MSSGSTSQHRLVGAGRALDTAGGDRWWYVLLDLAATEKVPGPVVLNITACAPVDDPHGWCGDTFWLACAESIALAGALRREVVVDAEHAGAAVVAGELRAPGTEGEVTWARVHVRVDGAHGRRQVVLEFIFAGESMAWLLDVAQATSMSDALARASEA